MTLAEYLDEHAVSLSAVMRRSGVAYTTALRAKRGEPVALPAAKKISAATDGLVTVAELVIGDESEPAPSTGTEG